MASITARPLQGAWARHAQYTLLAFGYSNPTSVDGFGSSTAMQLKLSVSFVYLVLQEIPNEVTLKLPDVIECTWRLFHTHPARQEVISE